MAEASPVDDAASAPQPDVPQLITPPPARLADIMMSRPYLEGGRFTGIAVYPGERREMFASPGLKSGDVIVRIDGHELSAADTAAPFHGRAADASMT